VCGVIFPNTVDFFNQHKHSCDGLTAACRNCRNIKSQQRAKQFRNIVIDHYGGACACCGEDRHEFLAIDHINGGGRKHRDEIGWGSSKLERWIIKNNFPDNFRILCNNCNMAYGTYGYCPHNILPPSFVIKEQEALSGPR
jgi:hypothetical protein